MDKLIKKANKGNLKNKVITNLQEEYFSVETNFQAQETNYDGDNRDKRNLEIENPNELEQDMSEIIQTKNRKKLVDTLGLTPMCGVRKRAKTYEKLPNGLTPHEIMYGKEDDDFDYINKSLE